MEQLISFATKNFFIVIIIVGILYQLFFRKSPLEKPRNRMPDFGGGQPQRPPGSPPQRGVPMRIPAEKQEQRRVPSANNAPRPEPKPIVAENVYEDVYEERPTAVAPASATPALRVASTHAVSRPAVMEPTQDDLARAVLWAEILGPPRARRPHRR